MKIDIQIPKDAKGLYTLAKALTEKEISERNPAWYAPDALRYDDCLLIDDWDNNTKVLDSNCDYETIDDAEAAEKYLGLFYAALNSNDLVGQQNAYSICGLLLHTRFYMNSDLHRRLKTVEDDYFPFPMDTR